MVVSVVMDLYSQKIVGWSFRSRMDSHIKTRALVMAVPQRKGSSGVLVHRGRGLQVTRDVFQKQLADTTFVQSMSRIGDCWDNAAMERFLGTMKH